MSRKDEPWETPVAVAAVAAAGDAAARALSGGGAVAFPTESFYGLAVRPYDEAALALLLALKRERGLKPLPLVLATPDDVREVAEGPLPESFHALAQRFWPGPLTLVIRARPDLPAAVTGGTGSVGVRVPAHDFARALAAWAGGVVTATSANPSGLPPPRTVAEVLAYFPSGLALIIDGGATAGGLASTVVDLTREPPRLVRAGPITAAMLAEAVGGECLEALPPAK